jgi:hypothetical protein
MFTVTEKSGQEETATSSKEFRHSSRRGVSNHSQTLGIIAGDVQLMVTRLRRVFFEGKNGMQGT